MKRILCVIVASWALSGCAYLRAVSFQEDDNSGVTDTQVTKLFVIPASDSQASDEPAPKDGKKTESEDVGAGRKIGELTSSAFLPKQDGAKQPTSEQLAAAEQVFAAFSAKLEECMPPKPPGIGPKSVGVALFGFLAEQGIALFTDALSARVEELQEKSQRTYSASLVLDDPEEFNNAACMVVLRGLSEKDSRLPKEIGLALVLKITHAGKRGKKPDSVIVQPTFVYMQNAVAITGEGQPVDVAVALVAKAARVKDNVRRVDAFAQISFSMPGVPLGMLASDLPDPSGLAALAPTDASAVEVTVGITESGTGLPDAEKAKAELKALAEALGPELVAKAKALAGD